jgi:hypothetical protein
MINHRINILIIIILLLVCTLPVSAAILNVTDIYSQNFDTIIIESGSVNSYTLDLQTGSYVMGGNGGFGGGGAGGRGDSTSTGVIKDYRSRVMGKQVIHYTYENVKLNFQYERVDGTKITGYILLIPSNSNIFSGDKIVHINENNFNSSIPYARAPVLNILYSSNMQAFSVLDPGTMQQYFTIAERVGGTGVSIYSWDNSTVANIPVTDMTKNPIYKLSFTSTSPFTLTTYAISIEDFTKSLGKAIDTGVCTGNYWYCLLDWIFSPLKNAINELSKFAGDVKGFYDGTYAIAAFIFSAQIIVGMTAFYTAIAILLSIEDSDDLFKAFGSFWRREMKLFRFYMEIFRAIKDMIKWW